MFFLSLGNRLVIFIFFMMILLAAVVYNFSYADTSGLITVGSEDIEAWPTQGMCPEVTVFDPESTLPQTDAAVTMSDAQAE